MKKINNRYLSTLIIAISLMISGCCPSGCYDIAATNYNKSASSKCLAKKKDCKGVMGGTDNSCCTYKKTTPELVKKVYGCTDAVADNFNPDANEDNGSCKYTEVILKPYTSVGAVASLLKGMTKSEVKEKLGIFPYEMYHNKDNCEIHVYHYRRVQREFDARNEHLSSGLTEGKDKYENIEHELTVFFRNGLLDNIINDNSKYTANSLLCYNDDLECNTEDHKLICYGCKDPEALNYNPNATQDDGSCSYAPVTGCMDASAVNFNIDAVEDDGSCEYCPCDYVKNPDYDNRFPECSEICILDPSIVKGCTDKLAYNYDPKANSDDGLCKYCPCDTEEYVYIPNPNYSENKCEGDPCVKIKRTAPNVNAADKDCDLCDVLDVNGKIGLELRATSVSDIIKNKK